MIVDAPSIWDDAPSMDALLIGQWSGREQMQRVD